MTMSTIADSIATMCDDVISKLNNVSMSVAAEYAKANIYVKRV